MIKPTLFFEFFLTTTGVAKPYPVCCFCIGLKYYQNKIFKSENDTHEFVAYFQKEMETKDGIISKLNDELIRKEVRMKGTSV